MQPSAMIGFHESSIVTVRRDDTMIVLELEGVHVGNETHSATIRIKGVRTITRDGIQVDDFVLESEDGEVLTLAYTESALHLIVEWPDFINHQNKTCSYRITFASIEVAIN